MKFWKTTPDQDSPLSALRLQHGPFHQDPFPQFHALEEFGSLGVVVVGGAPSCSPAGASQLGGSPLLKVHHHFRTPVPKPQSAPTLCFDFRGTRPKDPEFYFNVKSEAPGNQKDVGPRFAWMSWIFRPRSTQKEDTTLACMPAT